jgi:uncharacterized protein
MNFVKVIANELKLSEKRVAVALALFDDGATVPFIARYRKDQTDTLNEIELRDIQHRYEYFQELDERKTSILNSIQEQNLLSDDLKKKIEDCLSKIELEDLYLPFKPKRRTRATVARELGLEPFAELMLKQEETSNTAEEIARIYLSEEKGLVDPNAAIKGACDILAENLADTPEFRQYIRTEMEKSGLFTATVKKEFAEKKTKFQNYYDFKEPVSKIPSHRILAMRRGEKEKVLRLEIEVDDAKITGYLCKSVIKGESIWKDYLIQTCKDAWERLMKGALETEVRLLLKKRADEEALHVFGKNLQDVLLAPPAGQKSVLAVDPGFVSGCKLAVMDKNGKFLDKGVIYPNEPQKKITEARHKIMELVEKYAVEMIAIGSGTASRETDAFISSFLSKMKPKPIKVVVNESGASVYSASIIAIEEFPEEDITTRGAISIGRRLQDPLAELVKVEPKAIGVGQYQHDVNQSALQKSLDEVVESCVNNVGVNLNTASESLLKYVSGISKVLAKNIIDYRNTKGAFKSRKELLEVSKFGAKAFEQAAGFLRIPDAENPLDASAVHPENYALVEEIAVECKQDLKTLVGNGKIIKEIDTTKYQEKVGVHTLNDILAELEKPARDPRRKFAYATFDEKVQGVNDLVTGSWMEGVVTNVTNFGAFVDVGVHQDGLVHVSEISDKFVKDAKTVVAVGDVVKVRVLGVDPEQKRVSLSMKQEGGEPVQHSRGPRRKPAPQAKPPIEQHSTLADLRNKFEGSQGNKKKSGPKDPPKKPAISLKSLMRSGR